MKRAKPSQSQCRCRAYVRFLVRDCLFCKLKRVGIARQYTKCTNSVKPFLRAVTVVSFLENIPGPLRGGLAEGQIAAGEQHNYQKCRTAETHKYSLDSRVPISRQTHSN